MDHRTLKTGCKLTFLGMKPPTYQLPFLTFLYCYICGRSQACCIVLRLLYYLLKESWKSWPDTPPKAERYGGEDEGERKGSVQPTCTFSCQHQLPQRKGKSLECKTATGERKTHRHTIFHSLEQSSAFGHGWDSAEYHKATSWGLGSRDTTQSTR